MFLVTWIFDKLGYMPKISIDTSWPFAATAQEYKPHEFEVTKDFSPRKKPATKKVAKKTTTVRKKKA